MIVMKLHVGKKIVTLVLAYASQCELDEEEKDKFYDELIRVMAEFGENEFVVLGGDLTRHVGEQWEDTREYMGVMVLV